jgi:hypothetical protein
MLPHTFLIIALLFSVSLPSSTIAHPQDNHLSNAQFIHTNGLQGTPSAGMCSAICRVCARYRRPCQPKCGCWMNEWYCVRFGLDLVRFPLCPYIHYVWLVCLLVNKYFTHSTLKMDVITCLYVYNGQQYL